MNQKATQCFESPCGKSRIYVDNDMPLGVFHDFLMMIKGSMVERMVQAQKQEQAIADAHKEASCDTSDCFKEE